MTSSTVWGGEGVDVSRLRFPNLNDSLGSGVQNMLVTVGLADLESTIMRIASETHTDPTNANLSLAVIDATIPGLGLHNVNERTETGSLSGVYRIEDRPIFRAYSTWACTSPSTTLNGYQGGS